MDEIEVRFILDPSVLATSLLAGTTDLTLGRTLSLDQALQIQEQWSDGRIENTLRNWMVIYPQLLNPTPSVVSDVRFRRALLQTIDRQQLAETLQAGQVPVAHSYISPATLEYHEIEDEVVRYDYDPAAAARTIDAIGYTRGADGFFHDDTTGRQLTVELRTTGDSDLNRTTIPAIADAWQRTGVGVETNLIPPERLRDREYRALSPAFELLQQANDLPGLATLHSREIPTSDNNYTGRSKNRYRNPDFDALIDRYFATIPHEARIQVLGQVMHQVTDQVTMLGLFYLAYPTLMRNRVLNVGAGGDRATQAWNAHDWDVR
jgi:ABC-type transport system substrate-binding protein